MDFGTGGLGLWVPFVPTWRGNRELPADERLSLEIRLMRPVDQMAMISETDDTIFRWRDERMAAWMDDEDMGPQIRRYGADVLRAIRKIDDHTRNWRNFTDNGRELTDAVELCLLLSIPRTQDTTARLVGLCEEMNLVHIDNGLAALEWVEGYQDKIRSLVADIGMTEKCITHEVREAIDGTAGLTGDELKNFVGSFDGSASATNGDPTDGPTVPTAPRAADSGQDTADISPATGTTDSQP